MLLLSHQLMEASGRMQQNFAAEGLKDANVIGRVGDPGMTFQNPLKKNKMSKAMKRHMRRTKRGNQKRIFSKIIKSRRW